MDIFAQEADLDRKVYKEPIDPAIIKTDPAGNSYVVAYDVVKIADKAFKERWSLEIDKTWSETIGDYDMVFFASVTVTVPGLGRRSAVGGVSFRDILRKSGRGKSLSELSPNDVQPTRSSDLYKMSVTDGMKKAMSLFQICGDVYTSERDKMETGGGERSAYGAPAPPKPSSKLGELSEENKAKAKKLMADHDLKKMSELGKALTAAGLETLDNESLEKFKAHLESKAAKPEEKKAEKKDKKKDIPV